MEKREVGENIAMEALASTGGGESFFDEAGFEAFLQQWQAGEVADDNSVPVEEAVASENVSESPVAVEEEAVTEADDEAGRDDVEAGSSAAAEPALESDARAEGEVGEAQRETLGKVARVALNNTPRSLLGGILGHKKQSSNATERARAVVNSDRQGLESVPTTPAQTAAARLSGDLERRGRKVETPEQLRERTEIFIENWNLSRKMKLEELQEYLQSTQAHLEDNMEALNSGQITDESLRMQYIEAAKECEAAIGESERAIKQIQRDMGEHENLTDSQWQDIMAATQLSSYVSSWYQEEQAHDPEFAKRFDDSSDVERINEFKQYLSNRYYNALDERDVAVADDYGDKVELVRQLSISRTPMVLEELFRGLVQQPKRNISVGEAENA